MCCGSISEEPGIKKKRKVQIVKVALEPQSFPLMLLSVHAFNNHYLVALPSLLIISETWFVMMLTNVIKAPLLSSKRCFCSALLKRKTWMCWLAFFHIAEIISHGRVFPPWLRPHVALCRVRCCISRTCRGCHGIRRLAMCHDKNSSF